VGGVVLCFLGVLIWCGLVEVFLLLCAFLFGGGFYFVGGGGWASLGGFFCFFWLGVVAVGGGGFFFYVGGSLGFFGLFLGVFFRGWGGGVMDCFVVVGSGCFLVFF